MSQTSSNPATLRLPFKEKLAYGLGDLGSNILLDIDPLFTQILYRCAGFTRDLRRDHFPDRQIFYRIYRYGYRHYARLAA